jgi:NTP pyrophosphatase (non-canonical NTP hydrolase)
MSDKPLNPWHPIKDPVLLKTLGKFAEELGECSAATARCIIQGVDEVEPTTGKPNRQWLEEEIADVLAGVELTITRLGMDRQRIADRANRKAKQLASWHAMGAE